MIDHTNLSSATHLNQDNSTSQAAGNDQICSSLHTITEMLTSKNPATVLSGLQKFSSLDSQSQLFVPKIVTLSSHNDKVVRQAAISALSKLRSDEKLIIYTLKKCLHDKEVDIRRIAASTLAQFASTASNTVYDLADRVINDTDAMVQELCCDALAAMGSDAQPALPALVQHLQHGNNGQRIAACRTISKIGINADMAKPALIQALQDSNTHVRNFASTALGSVNIL